MQEYLRVKGKKIYFRFVDLYERVRRNTNSSDKMGNAQVRSWWMASISINV